jgi:hypothetical protein
LLKIVICVLHCVLLCSLQLRAENQQLRAAAASAAAGDPGARAAAAGTAAAAAAAAAAAEGPAALRKQLKEFTLNTQLELERKLKVGRCSYYFTAEPSFKQLGDTCSAAVF